MKIHENSLASLCAAPPYISTFLRSIVSSDYSIWWFWCEFHQSIRTRTESDRLVSPWLTQSEQTKEWKDRPTLGTTPRFQNMAWYGQDMAKICWYFNRQHKVVSTQQAQDTLNIPKQHSHHPLLTRAVEEWVQKVEAEAKATTQEDGDIFRSWPLHALSMLAIIHS